MTETPAKAPRLSDFLLTLTRAADLARALGWTLRRTSCGSAFVAYPRGTSASAPEAYEDSDPAGCLGTVMAAGRRVAQPATLPRARLWREWRFIRLPGRF